MFSRYIVMIDACLRTWRSWIVSVSANEIVRRGGRATLFLRAGLLRCSCLRWFAAEKVKSQKFYAAFFLSKSFPHQTFLSAFQLLAVSHGFMSNWENVYCSTGAGIGFAWKFQRCVESAVACYRSGNCPETNSERSDDQNSSGGSSEIGGNDSNNLFSSIPVVGDCYLANKETSFHWWEHHIQLE